MPNYSGIWTLSQQAQAKAASNWPSPPLVIGQAYAGGFYAGQIGVSGVATHNLVVAPLSSGQFGPAKWKNANTATAGADSDINGPQNTADMVADGSSTVYPCAHFCNDLSTGGQTDWYMPAKNELEVVYFNLKPTTTSNNTASGINPNSVPVRTSNYTSGNPAQTSAVAFQTGNAEAFAADYYWSSTEYSAVYAWVTTFPDGRQFNGGKGDMTRVRAIRRVAV
jgi:hypothetical protein